MARYIDADKAKHEFNIGFGGVSHAVIANQIIDSTPTADVVEVKHGEWMVIKGEKEKQGTLTCSCCLYTYRRLHPKNYCPSCGAKMDGQ